ncbi:MAG: ATP-dependent helicase [Lawsonibacter sp.]
MSDARDGGAAYSRSARWELEGTMEFSQWKERYSLSLDEQQEQAVQAVDGPVLLLAVPGSGKTTVLVSRVGYLCLARGIPPEQILTMTCTVAAARDMRTRFTALFGEQAAQRLEFRTINGVCSQIIRTYERRLGRTAFTLLEDAGQRGALLGELYRAQTGEFAAESTVKALMTAVTYAKNQMLTGEELAQVQVEGVEFSKIFRDYEQALRQSRRMDYDDQMVYALRILRQHPRILEEFQGRFRYFCVDEAQDTSRIQHRIIRMLAGQSQNLFLVGDEDQSIYGFRAADPSALVRFPEDWPGARVLRLEQNYRSTREIVAAADRFIQKNTSRLPKHMRAVRGSGPAPEEISVYDRQRQYRWLAKLAKSCDRETAVLYRDNDSALPLIDLLERAGTPYRCRQVESAFFTSRVVRDVTDVIRFALDPWDGERFLAAVVAMLLCGPGSAGPWPRRRRTGRTGRGRPSWPISAVSPGRLPGPEEGSAPPREHPTCPNLLQERGDRAVYRIVHFMGYGAYLEEHGMDGSRADILEAIGANQPTPLALLERLEELEQVVRAGAHGGEEVPFLLSTIHSSKGLAHGRVILMDVAGRHLPQTVPEGPEPEQAESGRLIEEERRLFYVE